MLDLVAISYNELPPVVPIRGVIPDDGGTIGRDSENTISLPDPVRLVSRKHGRFDKENGGYYLANISDGNAFFVNEREVPAGSKCQLSDGDLLQIGGYVLRIRFANNKAAQIDTRAVPVERRSVKRDEPFSPNSAPVAKATSGLGGLGIGGAGTSLPGPFDDLLASPVQQPEECFKPSKTAEKTSIPGNPHLIPADFDPFLDGTTSIKPADSKEYVKEGTEFDAVMPKLTPFSVVKDDPELAKGSIEAMLAPSVGINENPLLADRLESDPLALFSDESSQSDLLDELSLNGDSNPIGLSSDLSASFKLPSTYSVDLMQPDTQHMSQLGVPGYTEDTDAVAEPESAATEVQQSVAISASTDSPPLVVPAELPVPQEPAKQKAVELPPAANFANATALPELGELKRALESGLQTELPGDATALNADVMRLVGALLRIAITGTLDLMRARSAVKKEVRVEMTVIEPNDNNPLKFSPDADVAIQYMFGRKYPGFLGPLDAMSEAYLDLASHQMAMVAGMRSAMEEMIRRFDPKRVEAEVETRKVLSRLSDTHRRSELWTAYCERYQGIADVLGRDFQDYYAQAFTRAYEEEVNERRRLEPKA